MYFWWNERILVDKNDDVNAFFDKLSLHEFEKPVTRILFKSMFWIDSESVGNRYQSERVLYQIWACVDRRFVTRVDFSLSRKYLIIRRERNEYRNTW